MKREIKFRGKSLAEDGLDDLGIPHDRDWVTGSLIYNDNGHPYIVGEVVDSCDEYIDLEYWVAVNPDTVGLCSGLAYKNGLEIYEGDVCHMGDENILYEVIWKDTGLCGRQIGNQSIAGLSYFSEKIEVIGNIHDNPELLITVKK